MKKPHVLILRTEGTNCDEEAAMAFELAGGKSSFVHINELREKKTSLDKFNILVLPGGFAYGDDIVSGKILAVELTSFFEQELKKFVQRKNTLIIGICNGFQVLVRTGLLPFRTIGTMSATLTNNDSGHFECRYVRLKTEKNSPCIFTKDMENEIVSYQVAHGEGKFFADLKTLQEIEEKNLVALRYVDEHGAQTQKYPDNPNGSLYAIAGVCDSTGRILGLMPHPERFVLKQQHPNWRRMQTFPADPLRREASRQVKTPQGLPIFKNAINFVKNA